MMSFLRIVIFVLLASTCVEAGLPPLISKDEGVKLTNLTTSINYVGAGVTATNVSGAVTVTIPGSAGSSGGAYFSLDAATVPYVRFGQHTQTATQSLTAVNIGMYNSGTSGSTVIQLNQYRAGSLVSSATASIASSGGNPSTSVAAALSGTLSLLSGDLVTADVNSVAGGFPEGLTVEY